VRLREALKALLGSRPRLLSVADVLLLPATLVAVLYTKALRMIPLRHLPASRAVFRRVGIFPLRDHYYEPAFLTVATTSGPRDLPGIDLRPDRQLELLGQLHYEAELEQFPRGGPDHFEASPYFHYGNGSFMSGDAEALYAVIRHHRPSRIIEIGSGFSTLMAAAAVARNREAGGPEVDHRCIEPYSFAWLDDLDAVTVVRERVEQVAVETFAALGPDDILFIDSSHVIRPGGDVLFEYLQLLPRVAPGVLVHIHDVFTPYDYPSDWVRREGRLWNEQYLLEAFLSCNREFDVVLALNYLARTHPAPLGRAFPVYAGEGADRPLGSIWLRRRADATAAT
jgi:predicted O-methyltransferase YrrM